MGSFKNKTVLVLKRICLIHLPAGERIAAYALIISIATMIFGFVQFSNQNEYADKQLKLAINSTKLAFRPFVMIHMEGSAEADLNGIILSNDGNGPAILYKIDVYYENRPVDIRYMESTLDGHDKFWKEGATYSYQEIYDYMTVKSGDRLPVLTVKHEAFENSSYQLERFLEKTSVVVLYTSLTNDTAMSSYNIDLLGRENILKYPAELIVAAKKGLIPTFSFQ